FLNFFLISLLVHLILFVSVFDIYFTSPIIHGMKQIDLPVQVPASRLVLFVADGLRADKFYELDEKGETRSPFLRNVVMNSGSWGVSHTRVPTESRPGHVALIAGFYEDVSAILKGWKENPIEFDSVFNKSRNTWAWGSPDILPMFARGENMSHVHIDCYRGDTQSFAGDDSSLLDEWVFDKVEKFFKLAETNKTLGGQLKEKNTVFFLHLLGIDTNGHSHYPMSKEYLDNIRKVDKGVEQVVDLFNQFYKDRKTAYVFTADHGMTDWGMTCIVFCKLCTIDYCDYHLSFRNFMPGSHGAGLASETLTPLVVWGAGAEKHNDLQMPLNDESIKTTRSWGLDPSNRRDVNQADIAPLMSSLVGSPIPVNSVGELPIEYLSMDSKSKSQLLHGNAQQLSEQFIVKMESIKNKTFTFSPFPKLSHSEIIDMNRKVTAFINQEKYEVANELSRKLSKLSLEGMSYFHTYHRTILYISIVLSFIGWIVEAVLMLIHQVDFISSQAKKLEPLTPKQKFHVLSLLFAAGGIFTSLRIFVLDLPPSYHLYCTLPICIWYHIFTQRYTIQAGMMYILSKSFFVQKIALYTTVSVIAMLALVFSFFFRYILTVELLVFGVAIFKTPLPYKTKRYWATVCTFAAVFPMLPTVGRAPNSFLVFGGGLMGGILSYHLRSQKNNSVFSRLIPFLPFIAGCIQPIRVTTAECHIHSQNKHILLPNIDNQTTDSSPRYHLIQLNRQFPSLSTIRIAYMFLFFIVLAFFGVGNIASINSFDVKVVLPFLTKFNHLVMGLLLAYKVLLPYLLVACTLCCIAVVSRTNLQQLCYAVVIVSDVMGMHFFFLVQDSGSWLDIGTSISHYVICMSMVLSVLIFLAAAKFLTSYSLL
uniref:GPI ethanolamine phosphate transferase 1 n=1 Tax=Ciona savignyi TaxID=51511 RepID=H2Z1S7_CIOSA